MQIIQHLEKFEILAGSRKKEGAGRSYREFQYQPRRSHLPKSPKLEASFVELPHHSSLTIKNPADTWNQQEITHEIFCKKERQGREGDIFSVKLFFIACTFFSNIACTSSLAFRDATLEASGKTSPPERNLGR
jgi:hypothetical protein